MAKNDLGLIKTKNLNLALGAIYFLQAVAVLIWAKATTVPVFSGHAAYDELSGGLGPAVRHLFDVRLSYLVVLLLLVSAVFHLLQATFRRKTHEAALKKKISRGRWLHFGISATLMVWVLALLSGINELSLLLLIGGFVATSKFFAYRMEITFNKDKKPTWAILHLAVITAGLALLPLVMSKIGTIIFGQTSFGALLYWAYAAVFATFAGFLLVESKYYHKKAPFSDYGYIDRAYSLVYLFGQTALTWLIFAGSLR